MTNETNKTQEDLLNELSQAAKENEEQGFLDTEKIEAEETPQGDKFEPHTAEDAPPPPELTTENIRIGDFITGKQIMTGVDSLLSALLAFATTKITKKEIDPKLFRMDAQELKNSGDILTECLKTIRLNQNNPWVAFAIVTGTIYAGKGATIASQIAAEQMNAPAVKKKSSGRGRPAGSKNKVKEETTNGGE